VEPATAIIDHYEPVGPLSAALATSSGIDRPTAPLLFPRRTIKQAGLVGGARGRCRADGRDPRQLGGGQLLLQSLPLSGSLDAMRLNWQPYLWMRCYNNGAQFLDKIVGRSAQLGTAGEASAGLSAGRGWHRPCLPFHRSRAVSQREQGRLEWSPAKPKEKGKAVPGRLEALAYLIARGVREHEQAGQRISRVTVSGGIARRT